jgi:hypothetical protein
LKNLRGYLVAALVAAVPWLLIEFTQSHWTLVDMIYPYMTRMVQDYLANWSSAVPFCLWQLVLIIAGVVLLATVVMMILWKWNVIQWFGWVLTGVSVVFLLNTAICGLNDYSGPLSQDIRLDVTDYSVTELETAASYYQEQANLLAEEAARDASGNLTVPDLTALSQLAAEGFHQQTYGEFNSVFAGSTVPVKELGWSGLFSARGVAGVTVYLTGEAAVNPQTPAIAMPFIVSRQMAQRMCITNQQDAAFAAFLVCDAAPDPNFRYSAYFMAYRYCHAALLSMDTAAAQQAAVRLTGTESDLLKQDMAVYGRSFASKSDDQYIQTLQKRSEKAPEQSNMVDLLVSWYIQEYVLPLQEEEVVLFDPLDENQVDMTGLPHVEPKENDEEDTI